MRALFIAYGVMFSYLVSFHSEAKANGTADNRKHKACIERIDASNKVVMDLQKKLIELRIRAAQKKMTQEDFDKLVEEEGSFKKFKLAQEGFNKSKSCLGELQWNLRIVNDLCTGVKLPLKTPQSQSMCEELALNFFDQQAVQAHISHHSKLTSSQRELLNKASWAQKRFVQDSLYEKLKLCSSASFTSPMYMGELFDDYIASNGLNAAIDYYNSSLGVIEDNMNRFRRHLECRHEAFSQTMKQAHQNAMNQAEIKQMLENNPFLRSAANEVIMVSSTSYTDSVLEESKRQMTAMNKHLKELQDGLRHMSDKIDRVQASRSIDEQDRKRAETAREMARQRERRLQREAQEWGQISGRSISPFVGGSGMTVMPGQW